MRPGAEGTKGMRGHCPQAQEEVTEEPLMWAPRAESRETNKALLGSLNGVCTPFLLPLQKPIAPDRGLEERAAGPKQTRIDPRV